MPVYAYACTACDHAFDARQGFDEAALTVCDACGGSLRKQYGSIGVTFNGSGFYRTDSRAAQQSGSSSGSSSSGSGSASGGSGSSSSGGSSSAKPASGSSAAKTSSGPQPAAKSSAA